MKPQMKMKTGATLQILVLAGALWVCHPAGAADGSSEVSSATISAPATSQETVKPGGPAGEGPSAKQSKESGLGDKAFPLAVVLIAFAWLSFSSWCDYRKRSVLLTRNFLIHGVHSQTK
jgi:hypothetical protein